MKKHSPNEHSKSDNSASETLYYDSIIVGSGLAGLSTALRLANNKQKVALITKRNLAECNSYYAQGGIAAVLNSNDSIDNHIQDTLVAGAGLCKEDTVRYIIEHSAWQQIVSQLIERSRSKPATPIRQPMRCGCLPPLDRRLAFDNEGVRSDSCATEAIPSGGRRSR